MDSAKNLFSRFYAASPERTLHASAHSHHAWPDATFEAQQEEWLDAVRMVDDKWDHIYGEVVPATQHAVAGILGLPDPETLVFAANTHQFVVQILSSLDGFGSRPVRILTTDAEFHSAARQFKRLEEEGMATVDRIAAQPFDTYLDRLCARLAEGRDDFVYLSHVHFDSAYVTPDLPRVVAAVPDSVPVMIDGYHSFMALPVDLGAIADRAFYTAGGYKYAMAGEGCCFLHAPPGWIDRPVITGWFAGFGQRADDQSGAVHYDAGGARFAGGTFDATGVYRLRASLATLDEAGWTVDAIHRHVRRLQKMLLDALAAEAAGKTLVDSLIPPWGIERGNFLTFVTPRAGEIDDALAAKGVIVDHRNDRLRVGLGIYHDDADIVERLAPVLLDAAS